MNDTPAPRAQPVDWLLAGLSGAGALILYNWTLAPTVLAGDPGELQFAAPLLGVTHPTGYPLYTLLGWGWSHLSPLGDAAYRMNLFSAVWGALAVGLLYLGASALLRQALPGLVPLGRRLAALLAAATFAVTPTFWSQAIIAEVYTLHILLIVALFYCLLAWREAATEVSARRTLLLAACCFGLGLAHHRTTLVLVPAVAAYLWLAGRPLLQGDHRGRQALGLALAVSLPLLLYLMIPWRAPHTPYLRLPLAAGRELVLYENTAAGFFDFVLGGPFGGSIDLSVNLGERLAMAGQLFWAEVPWPGLALALLGLGRLAWRRAWALLALTGLACLGTAAFNLVYTIGDVYVLFIPAYLAVVLWLAVGAGVLMAGLARALPRLRPELAAAAVALLWLALPVWMVLSHYEALDRSGDIAAYHDWAAILAEPLPQDAVLVSNDRNDIMPMWYLQTVEEQRPDLLGLFPLITPEYAGLGDVLDLATSTDRPVYLIKDMPGIEIKVRTTPEGRLWRVDGPAVEGEPSKPRDLRLHDSVRLAGYDQAPANPEPGQTLSVSLIWEALGPVEGEAHSFVHLLDAAGQKVAQSDRQPGGVYYPSTLWKPGELLRDDHTLSIPPGTAPGTYRLLVGLYELAADGTIVPLGEPVVAGDLQISAPRPAGSLP